jgi:type I restriction enzyme M protein
MNLAIRGIEANIAHGDSFHRDAHKAARLEEVRPHGHVLTPGRYVGAEAAEDDGERFEEKMRQLTATLREQQAEAARLDAAIAETLRELGFPINE